MDAYSEVIWQNFVQLTQTHWELQGSELLQVCSTVFPQFDLSALRMEDAKKNAINIRQSGALFKLCNVTKRFQLCQMMEIVKTEYMRDN